MIPANQILKLESECFSIREYAANENISVESACNLIGINQKFYIIMHNGKTVKDNYIIEKGEIVTVFYNISGSLEKKIMQ